jgi:hypothetical protein
MMRWFPFCFEVPEGDMNRKNPPGKFGVYAFLGMFGAMAVLITVAIRDEIVNKEQKLKSIAAIREKRVHEQIQQIWKEELEAREKETKA